MDSAKVGECSDIDWLRWRFGIPANQDGLATAIRDFVERHDAMPSPEHMYAQGLRTAIREIVQGLRS